MILIGIDCAVSEKNIGLAKGEILITDRPDHSDESFQIQITEVVSGGEEPVMDTMIRWIADNEKVLFCLDAPLGWPKPMGELLARHTAGEQIHMEKDSFFTRYTDNFLRDTIGKRPMEVGANLIARTAHSALNLLEQIRRRTGVKIPLAWKSALEQHIEAIEVYPAGTLAARKWEFGGYKKKANVSFRTALLDQVSREMDISLVKSIAKENHHILDAILCLLTGQDFLNDHCYHPENLDLAKKEGWIWFRRSDI